MFSKNVLNYNILERSSTLRFSMNALWRGCEEVQQHPSSQEGRMTETCNKYNEKIDTWDTYVWQHIGNKWDFRVQRIRWTFSFRAITVDNAVCNIMKRLTQKYFYLLYLPYR